MRRMRRTTVKYTPEYCPARNGLMCDAHPDYPELRCHIDIDPARPCEFIRVEKKGKEVKEL